MHFLHAPLLQNEGNPDGVMIPLRQMQYHEASRQWPLIQYWSAARVACIDLALSIINITTHLNTEEKPLHLKF